MSRVFQQRIEYWQTWKAKHGIEGDLFNFPGQNGSIDYGAVRAEEELNTLLKSNAFNDTAIVCTNIWTALGVKRAIQNNGLSVGKDISVCAINDEMLAPWLNPTLTSLRMPDPVDMLSTCVQWMVNGGRDWAGSKLLVPRRVPLFKGESTGPSTST